MVISPVTTRCPPYLKAAAEAQNWKASAKPKEAPCKWARFKAFLKSHIAFNDGWFIQWIYDKDGQTDFEEFA